MLVEQYVHRKVWDEGWKDKAFTAFLGRGSDALKRSIEATPEHQPCGAKGKMGRHHRPITHQQRQRNTQPHASCHVVWLML
jgi:hypothetical protein